MFSSARRLNESDYRSQERTYQLITQAVGRAGRGTKPGTAVIQTYQPENSTLRYAAAQSYGPFYREEIAYRKIMRYPPVGGLLAILGSAASEELLTVGMGYIRKYIDIIDKRGVLAAIGPANGMSEIVVAIAEPSMATSSGPTPAELPRSRPSIGF